MNDPGPIELPNGVRFGCDCKTCNETRDREIAADNERRKLGPLPPAPAVERHLVGLAHHPTIWEVAGPVVATLPTGERVELPAGTVLREGTGGRAYEPAIIAMREPRPVCCKAAIECSALNWQPLVPSWQMTWGCVQHCPFCGDRLTPPPIKLASAEEERAILPRVVGYTIRERRGERTQIIVGDADGRTIELMHVTPAMLMRAADRRVHGEENAKT